MNKVLFSKEINPKIILEIFKKLNIQLEGRVAIKVHSGEAGNQNFLKPELWKDVIEYVNGTVVECNTAYEGERNTSDKHLKLLSNHGWTKHFDCEILDEKGPDLILDIPNGKVIKKNFIGNKTNKFDSVLVLSHFKGHPMGGYGGALKQLSIGFASSYGKAYIHGAGDTSKIWSADHDLFLESMADAASSITELFKNKIAYINVMANMSVDCDCCSVAEDPCISDIGILASLDPVALDQACIDLIYSSKDKNIDHFIERIETRNGLHTIEVAEKLKIGSRKYELIEI